MMATAEILQHVDQPHREPVIPKSPERREPDRGPGAPEVSFVIITHNGERTIGTVLESIFMQSYRDFEVIVVDDCSTDSTANIVKDIQNRHPRSVRHYQFPERQGHGGALNSGIQRSYGRYVVQLYDDLALGSADWLEVMLKTAASGKCVASSLYLTNPSRLDIVNRLFSYVYILGWHSVDSLSGIHYVAFSGFDSTIVPRSVFEHVGLFSEEFRFGGQDIDFSERLRRAGYRLVLNADVHVENLLSSHQRGIRAHLKKAWQYGAPSAIILRKYGYLIGFDNALFSFSLALSLALIVLHAPLGVIGVTAAFISATVLSVILDQPDYFMKKKTRTHVKKALASWVLGFSAFAVFHPLFLLGFGGAVPFAASIQSAAASRREGNSFSFSAKVFWFNLAWKMINGFATLAGFSALPRRRRPDATPSPRQPS